MLIYLASPIDKASEEMAAMRQQATEALMQQGFVVFTPATAFHVPEEAPPDDFISRIDDHALSQSHGILALLPDGVPTLGVPIEIGEAIDLGLPVAVVGGHYSWSLTGRPINRFHTVRKAAAFLGQSAMPGTPRRSAPIVVKVAGNGRLPTRAHPGDAGFDLYTLEDTVCKPGAFTPVHTGIHVQVPWDYYYIVCGRSSTSLKRGLQVNDAVIDAGYTGELFANVFNPGEEDVLVREGERVAQFLIHRRTASEVEFEQVEALDEHKRGTAGMGSSGR